MLRILTTVGLLLLASVLAADGGRPIKIKGGCAIGAAQAAIGHSADEADAKIREYANYYVKNYTGYRDTERKVRRESYAYMEKKKWKQADVIGFLDRQRELLYLSVGRDLGSATIDIDALAAYIAAIEERLLAIEEELGCTPFN